ncbi:hypothetical protein [Lentzea kentuckyensis]|uniref:hypothetical protein n=1 Tax=Lentzea kentuckyensis TaxID=360086 RepID=UPI001B807764|nr:hypothetical protein [Lentzea kentuckyensis]
MNLPLRVAIDTNVLKVANGQAPQASGQCEIATIEFLEHAEQNCIILIDDLYQIFDEYKKHCNFSGQPGVGDHFFMYLYRAQADRRRVNTVSIHPDGDGSYQEVPAALAKFDPSDKKFIATVIADARNAPVVNAVDSDWSESKEALQECGVDVYELCPGCLKST